MLFPISVLSVPVGARARRMPGVERHDPETDGVPEMGIFQLH